MDMPSPPIPHNPAADKVKAPAIALMVTAGLGIVMIFFGIVMRFLGMAGDTSQLEGMEGMEPLIAVLEVTSSMSYMVVTSTIGLCVAGLIIFAAMKMMKLEMWGLCLGVSIAAAIPCISPCCCVGLPIGIWAVIVLLNDDVKQAFH